MMASCCNRAFDVDTDSFPRLYFFFFNDTATTEIYTLSLHDALPIFASRVGEVFIPRAVGQGELAVQLPLVPRVEAVAPRPRMIDVRNLKDSAPVRRGSQQERRERIVVAISLPRYRSWAAIKAESTRSWLGLRIMFGLCVVQMLSV